MADTDVFNFANLRIFDSIKKNLPEGAREICDVFEDLVFVWNFKESNLLVANWRSAQARDIKATHFQASYIIIFNDLFNHLICLFF